MKSRLILMVCLIGTLLFLPSGSYAETIFVCDFIQEKREGGKSNEASCSGNPEYFFSSNPSTEHCKVEEVYYYNDLLDFYIDDSLVTWKIKYGLTEKAKPDYIRRRIQEGELEEKAIKSAEVISEGQQKFQVYSHFVSSELVPSYKKKKPDQPPPLERQIVHIYTFGGFFGNFTLHVPEVSKQAILIQYSSSEHTSWIDIRFGQCRKIEK